MKKIDEGISEYVRYLTLYRDDIKMIYEILHEVGDDVKLEIDGYSLDSLGEINDLSKNTASDVKVKLNEPWIHIKIDRNSTAIYTSNHDYAIEGIVYKIKQNLETRQNKFVKNFNENTGRYYAGYIVALIGVGIFSALHVLPINSMLIFSLISVIALIPFIGLMFGVWNKTTINLMYKKDNLSFIKRNKDEILVGLLLLVVGAIIGKML